MREPVSFGSIFLLDADTPDAFSSSSLTNRHDEPDGGNEGYGGQAHPSRGGHVHDRASRGGGRGRGRSDGGDGAAGRRRRRAGGRGRGGGAGPAAPGAGGAPARSGHDHEGRPGEEVRRVL